MKIINFETKIKKKGFVIPDVFTTIPYPDKNSPFRNTLLIAFTYRQKQQGFPLMFLDYGLHLNSNYASAGIWYSEKEAKEFILKKFYE